MGRAPCCDKANVKRGPWSPEEDAKLKSYIEQHGTGGNWIALPQKIGLKRCGKSCRLRWLNYLRPNIKHGGFTEEEDNIICSLYVSIGSRWSIIAGQLPGRTDNDIKNYWNTRLKKKLLSMQRKEQQAAQGRRVGIIKQEIKRENEDLMMTSGGIMTQNAPYWPVENISVPMTIAASTANSIQLDHYDLNNQESLRSLLTKLGGRFWDDNYQQPYNTTSVIPTVNPLYPRDISSYPHQIYATSVNLTKPEVGMNIATDNDDCNSQPPNMFQGFENFPSDLTELVYGKPQQTDAFGIMEDIGNASTGTTSTESTTSNWGDMSSLVYSPLVNVSDHYEGCPQGIRSQDVVYQESRYFGMQ